MAVKSLPVENGCAHLLHPVRDNEAHPLTEVR